MSGFVRQNGTECPFTNADSWVILNPIEQSIKRKIEAVGVPLKDWDIKINRGILTGCNEAFIIDEAKRSEIIAADPKSAEIIRPILRGRDIKRYGYTWANLYLIATFPSRHYDIEEYPAVKDYLLTFDKQRLLNAHLDEIANSDILLRDFCRQRLEQCGKDITINGHRVLIDGKAEKSRKKTGNKWFETQDQIGYWEDFSKQKIVWARLMRLSANDIDAFPRFCLVPADYFTVDSLCFFTGNNLNYLVNALNSEYAAYYFFNTVATLDNGGFQMRQQYVDNIRLPPDTGKKLQDAFGFSHEEKSFISKVVKKRKKEILAKFSIY